MIYKNLIPYFEYHPNSSSTLAFMPYEIIFV